MQTINMKEIGNIIRDKRKSQNLTLEELSGLANVGIRFLSELENGKETASMGKVLHVMQTLGLQIIIKES